MAETEGEKSSRGCRCSPEMMFPCMGMVMGAIFFGFAFYAVRQWSRVRLKALEVRLRELEKA
ncbi:MAG: hypothetical protein HYU86_04625 [Chloroflexi bacterium]|nr:hypothetical protein [Chloroflexota bacterium]